MAVLIDIKETKEIKINETENNTIVYNFSIPNSNEEIILRCDGLNLEETAICFKANIETFYNYSKEDPYYAYYQGDYKLLTIEPSVMTISPTNKTLLEYLKENGGKCCEWSLLYYQLCSWTNFNCSEVKNGGVEGVFPSHKYAVMFNETHYCKLDQLVINCEEIKA